MPTLVVGMFDVWSFSCPRQAWTWHPSKYNFSME
jgi:hypothetical protein